MRHSWARLLVPVAACAAAVYGVDAGAADAAGDNASDNTTLDTVIVTGAKARGVDRQVPTSITASPRDAQGIQHPVVRRLRDQDTDMSFTYGGGPTGIAELEDRRDSRYHRAEPVRYRGRHRVLHRRHAGAGFARSARGRYLQYRSAEGAPGHALRRELPRRQRPPDHPAAGAMNSSGSATCSTPVSPPAVAAPTVGGNFVGNLVLSPEAQPRCAWCCSATTTPAT